MVEVISIYDLFYNIKLDRVVIYPSERHTSIRTVIEPNLEIEDILDREGNWLPLNCAKLYYGGEDWGLDMKFWEYEEYKE